MNVPRSYFESENYPERFPEFAQLMALCDGNNLRMSFHYDGYMFGICVFDANNEAVTARTRYTLYYDCMEKSCFFLDFKKWDEGFALFEERLGMKLNLDVPPYVNEDANKKEHQFVFVIHHNGYDEHVAVHDESKWLAINRMRRLYPNDKFDLV